MWRTSVPETVNVGSDGRDIDAMMLGSLSQKLGIVDPLGSRQNLFSSHEHVVTVAVPEMVIELDFDVENKWIYLH